MLVLTDFLWYYVPLGFRIRRCFYVPVFSFFACLIALWLELVGCYYRFVFYLFFVILGRDVRVRMNNLANDRCVGKLLPGGGSGSSFQAQ